MRRNRKPQGYTLIEVLAAAVIIGLAISAAVSMNTTLVLQEELSWRTTVALNYQENAAKLWQLGLSPFEVNSLMPAPSGNPLLNSVLVSNSGVVGSITELGTIDADGVGAVEQANHTLTVNNVGSATDSGASPVVTIIRPSTR